MKKGIIIIVIAIVALGVLIASYLDDNSNSVNSSGYTKSFNVSEGSSQLSAFIKDVETSPYYDGYDSDCVEWMKSLGNKKIFYSDDAMVIMDEADAGKVSSNTVVTDSYIYEYFTANVIENHTLGDGKPTVYYVNNVEYTGEEIIGNGLA